MHQFADNLAKAKKISKVWEEKYRKTQQDAMRQIEEQIKEIYENNDEGVFSVDQLEVLRKMEGKKDLLLSQDERQWRLKSRALWLKEGDQNTKFFHRYASHRNSINTIYEIRSPQGNMVIYFS